MGLDRYGRFAVYIFTFFSLITLGSAEKGSIQDVCPEVSEEEAHCGHSPAGAHLLREENHVEGTLPLYCKVSKYWNNMGSGPFELLYNI